MSKRELILYFVCVLLLIGNTYFLFFKKPEIKVEYKDKLVKVDSLIIKDSIIYKTITKEVPANIFFVDTVKVYQPNYIASYDTSYNGFTANISFRSFDKTFQTRFVIPEIIKEVVKTQISYEKQIDVIKRDNYFTLGFSYISKNFDKNYIGLGVQYNKWISNISTSAEANILYNIKTKSMKPELRLRVGLEL